MGAVRGDIPQGVRTRQRTLVVAALLVVASVALIGAALGGLDLGGGSDAATEGNGTAVDGNAPHSGGTDNETGIPDESRATSGQPDEFSGDIPDRQPDAVEGESVTGTGDRDGTTDPGSDASTPPGSDEGAASDSSGGGYETPASGASESEETGGDEEASERTTDGNGRRVAGGGGGGGGTGTSSDGNDSADTPTETPSETTTPTPTGTESDSSDDGRMLWSDPATWGGEKPGEGDTVTITEDMDVVLDESPPELEGIYIEGGSLAFDRQDLDLRTGYIVLEDRGRLQIGSENDPFEHEATITLSGSRDDLGSAVGPGDHCGVKTICSLGGTLSIHGAVDGPTWTQLDATAEAGDRTITLTEPVDWEVGDEIALTSTSLEPGDVDRRTITAVEGTTVELDEPLDHTHYGEMQYFGPDDQYEVDERGEVLHLSRNVVIQGDESSEDERFGGHIMVMNEYHAEQIQRAESGENWPDIWDDYRNDPDLMPRISGVELRRMGQEGVLARYPFHWHRYGNAEGSYIENSAIHNSYQRCVTVHGTQQATVENNVAFDVTGHCYFLEGDFADTHPVTGHEDGTLLKENVGALVRPFSSEDRQHIRSDKAPAAFWTNGPPDSTVVDNVAAGVYGHGFWVDLESNGGHPSRLNQPLGTWDGNVAHSIHGNEPGEDQQLRIDQSFRSHIDTDGGAAFLIEGGKGEFTDLTAYKSPAGFWNDDATNIPVRESVIADTRNALWFQDGGVENSTIVAHTDNQNPETDAERRRGYTLPEPGNTRMGSAESVTGIVSFYQGARSANTAYIGYDTSDDVPHGVFGTMGKITSNPYFAGGNRLIDSDPYLPDLPKPGRDLEINTRVIPSADGGIVGEYDDEFRFSEFDGSEYRELRWGSDHLTDWETCEPIDYIDTLAGHSFDRNVYSCTGRSVSISYPTGNYSVNGEVYEEIGGKRGYLKSGVTYKYQGTLSPEFEANDRVGDLRIHRGYPGDYVVFAFPMEEKPTLSQVGQPPKSDLVEVDSKAAVQSSESTNETRYYWDSSENTLWLRVVTNPKKSNEFGTLPFNDEFDVPAKRSRDEGVQFD